MSSSIVKIEEEDEIQYVFDNSELVLDSSEINEDVIYSDGTQAILVNGHIIQGDSQTIVLQEGDDLAQYYIDENNEQILITEENMIKSEATVDENMVQYIEQEDSNGESQVIYISNEDQLILNDVMEENDGLDGNEEYQVKQFEFNGEIVDFDQILQQQNDGTTTLVDENGSGYHYAILKDGKLHLKTYTEEELLQNQRIEENVDPLSSTTDISKITGKNLLTGQTVTLHNYLDKLHKKNKEIKSHILSNKKRNDLKSLLNKKLPIGKTTNGKKLVGKIIHIEKNTQKNLSRVTNDDPELVDIQNIQTYSGEINDVTEMVISEQLVSGEVMVIANSPENMEIANVEAEDLNISPETIVVPEVKKTSKKITKASQEDLEHISRTLNGIMTIKNMKKKLIEKTIIIRVLEKKHIEESKTRKRASYSVGHMENHSVEENDEKWVYVQHTQNNEIITYEDSVNITIQITVELNGERKVKVVLNDEHFQIPGQEKHACDECGKHFNNPNTLKRHKQVHSPNNKFKCEICFQKFLNEVSFKKHKIIHMKSFQCKDCTKKFVNFNDYNQHMKSCSVRICSNQNGVSFMCFTCGKSFSRYSNLMRHVDIHKGGEALYRCDICGSSYNYISSLTRHIVQNHISKGSSSTVQQS